MDRRLDILRRNLDDVESRIAAACTRAGRPRSEVTLIAITKYVDIDVARLLLELGVNQLGESRPQELWRKAAAIPEATWHLVGHLQRNKIERTLPVAKLIHAIDSLRLLDAVEAAGQPCRALLEFNLSGEANKHGFALTDFEAVAERLSHLRMVQVQGLMTMAALDADVAQTRATFAALRQLRERFRGIVKIPTALPNLSMGMTNDLETAIEEGATLVRIGSALFRDLDGGAA